MSVEERANQILRGLWERPRLFWAFLKVLAKSRPVLGPWEETHGGRAFARHDAWGRMHANIMPLGKVDAVEGRWRWRVVDGSSKLNILASGESLSLELAFSHADARMDGDGYVLVGEPDPRVLCPWVDEDGSGRHVCRREDANGDPVAWIGKEGGWLYAQVEGQDIIYDGEGSEEPRGTRWFPTMGEAREAVDAELKARGWVLL
jgi:hypothetical protein